MELLGAVQKPPLGHARFGAALAHRTSIMRRLLRPSMCQCPLSHPWQKYATLTVPDFCHLAVSLLLSRRTPTIFHNPTCVVSRCTAPAVHLASCTASTSAWVPTTENQRPPCPFAPLCSWFPSLLRNPAAKRDRGGIAVFWARAVKQTLLSIPPPIIHLPSLSRMLRSYVDRSVPLSTMRCPCLREIVFMW